MYIVGFQLRRSRTLEARAATLRLIGAQEAAKGATALAGGANRVASIMLNLFECEPIASERIHLSVEFTMQRNNFKYAYVPPLPASLDNSLGSADRANAV